MTYVDAFHDRSKDIIRIVERVNGKRIILDKKPEYNFYYEEAGGKQRGMKGEQVSNMTCKGFREFQKNKKMHGSHKKLFESDIKPLNKVLAKHYTGAETPKLQTCFLDIEVDFCSERGYSTPAEAFMPITSIGVYLQWQDLMVCLAVPPKTITWEAAEAIAAQIPEVVLCKTEADMLDMFLQIIDDADVLSGWNSEGYDIPYIRNRIVKVLGKSETRRLCLFNEFPKERTFERYGSEQVTYDLVGRIHLDYLQLYRLYNYEERHSYRLDFIGEMEVDEKKVAYEGSLDRLYKQDFLKFLEYNIQDVMLLHKLDLKLQFIDLANVIAHDNTVLLPTTMGAVATTEQAIINETHRRGMVVPDRKRVKKEDSQAAGAYVAYPKKGFHEWIGSSDLNSLYPSVFRALNMAPETIVGQIRQDYTEKEIADKMAGKWIDPVTGLKCKVMSFAEAWNGKFGSNEFECVSSKDCDVPLILDLETGESLTCTGTDIHSLIFDSGKSWNISANGTVFSTDVQGIIPGLLERWYAERQEMQKKKKEYKVGTAEYNYWDKRQLVKKINLNSLYGAILNAGCRFFDKRVGQSTTLTGRRITRHMAAETNMMIAGKYEYDGESIIYGDTDSVYFTAAPFLPEGATLDIDSATNLYDHISDTVSDTFPNFLLNEFNIPLAAGAVMKAGREVVGRSGLFITKKRYAINVADEEGYRPEGGKLKIMGMDIKRSDTPEFVQDFLEGLLKRTLDGTPEDDIIATIREFKKTFKSLDPWLKGMPKRVNNLSMYKDKWARLREAPSLDGKNVENTERKNIPGHVLASINYNFLRAANTDNHSQQIIDGAKVIVCRLKPNPMGYASVAYPTDEQNLPGWFKSLPFDSEEMETRVLDKKIKNVLGVMGWKLERSNESDALRTFFDI
jgi:DNA polymerase elongation subunit (family B)